MASIHEIVPVVGGRIEIPRELFMRHIGGSRVTILKLVGRTEFWSPESLKKYMGRFPIHVDTRG